MSKTWIQRLTLGLIGSGETTAPVDASGVAITGRQTKGGSVATFSGGASPYYPDESICYDDYRRIRRHPTIALARALAIAPIVAAEWSVEQTADAPADAKQFIEDQLLASREDIIQKIAEAGIDYGWAPFEKVFEARDGYTALRKLKPLLHDITTILTTDDGSFAGFRQPSIKGFVDVELPYAFLVPFRVEGQNWYGEPLLRNAIDSWQAWRECDGGARRYDRKLAGSNWVVYYPPGSSPYNGAETDNALIAQAILTALESSGGVAVPARVGQTVDSLNGLGKDETGGWSIDTIGDSVAKQYSFVARAEYLDKLLVRALLVPERSLLEAQTGTRADASTHADASITLRETEHRYITRFVNWHVVDQLLALNWGDQARGTVELVAAPISDTNLTFLREVYKALLGNPTGFAELVRRMDWDSLALSLGIPTSETDNPDAPLAGADANDPMSAVIARLYAQLGKGRTDPAASDPAKAA